MSRFMSHREIKATARAIGHLENRLLIVEGVVGTLLNMAGLTLAKNDEGALVIAPLPPEAPEVPAESVPEPEAPPAITLTDLP